MQRLKGTGGLEKDKEKALDGVFSGYCETSRGLVDSSSSVLSLRGPPQDACCQEADQHLEALLLLRLRHHRHHVQMGAGLQPAGDLGSAT